MKDDSLKIQMFSANTKVKKRDVIRTGVNWHTLQINFFITNTKMKWENLLSRELVCKTIYNEQ